MSAIDHKKEAEYLAERGSRIPEDGSYWFKNDTETLLAAQVHATLALVEQTAALVQEQRTANLIANMNADLSAGYGIPKERLLEIQGRLA
jgi:hypothetical protein